MGRRPLVGLLAIAACVATMRVGNGRAEDPGAAARFAADGLKAFEAGHYQSAIESLSMAVKTDPHNPNYSMALGQAYLSAGKPKLAIPPLERSLAALPGDYDIRYALAEACYRRVFSVACLFPWPWRNLPKLQ